MEISKRRMLVLAICVVLAFIVSKYYCRVMLIRGNSMEPSFHNLQMVMLDVREREYHVGDVVAFKCDGLKAVLVKRVVAVSGDSIEIIGGELIVNGTKSTLFSDQYIEYSGIAETKMILSNDCYFMMGDNVQESIDSRSPAVGEISGSKIIGKVISF